MKQLFTLSLLLASLAAHAQITLEHTYAENVTPFKLSTGDIKYAGLNRTTNQVRIYNANHSIYRQLATGAPNGSELYDVLNVSDRLFNSTAGVEVAFTYRAEVSAGNSVSYLRVLDETGSTVLLVDSCSYAEPYALPTGAKLLAYVERNQKTVTKVYALPGTYTPLKTAARAADPLAGPYPNPTAEAIQLPYKLSRNETAELVVLDPAGRAVRRFTVDGSFDHLLLQARDLPSGVYTYQVGGLAGTQIGKKFVVQH
ncbi:T9SS type A sorting domain-containing protein [Hymenobacter yonginensis]|uniref:T9SS type A sorting domain-containing protein n=1 Tax=Hymenobacter yonginensis TaxID=748197 RepID=A0ABY7PT29_9BACT|nr:T9SS type A sorting domain-containing protein [Hymenobacter yonginensis]WBO86061.1 T9SS type A sorting domain-containing protein [Hymenobacter yonginensis]